jgi:hypothetical protein
MPKSTQSQLTALRNQYCLAVAMNGIGGSWLFPGIREGFILDSCSVAFVQRCLFNYNFNWSGDLDRWEELEHSDG